MSNTGFVTSKELTEVEFKACVETAKKYNPVMRQLSLAFYDGIHFRRLRREINQKKQSLSNSDRMAFMALSTMAQTLLEGHSLMVAGIARTFVLSRIRPSLTYDDYFQEGCLAIIDIAFSWDGSTMFTTYAMESVRRRLFDLVRVEAPLSPPAPIICKNKNQVRTLMAQGQNFDEAVQNLKLTEHEAENVRLAMVTVGCESQILDENTSFDDLKLANTSDFSETQELWDAFKNANLSPFERDVLTVYLQSKKNGAQSEVARQYNVTRMAAGFALKRALQKVKDQFEATIQREAA